MFKLSSKVFLPASEKAVRSASNAKRAYEKRAITEVFCKIIQIVPLTKIGEQIFHLC